MTQICTKRIPTQERLRVAVLPFKDAPDAPGSGAVATEAMTTYLLEVPNYDVIERGKLEEILKAQNIQNADLIDSKVMETLGKLLKANAFVVGSVTYCRDHKALIFPPAEAIITARMFQMPSETIEWYATYMARWHPLKWASGAIPPLLVYYTLTSPTANDCIKKAAKGIVKSIKKKTAF